MLRSITPASVLLVVATVAQPAAQETPVPFATDDALVTLQVDGPAAMRAAFAGTNLASLLDAPKVRALYAPGLAMMEAGLRMAEREAGAELGELYDLMLDYDGRVTLSFDLFAERIDWDAGAPPPMAAALVFAPGPSGEVELADFADILGDLYQQVPEPMRADVQLGGRTVRAVLDPNLGAGVTMPAVVDGHLVVVAGAPLLRAVEHFQGARRSPAMPAHLAGRSVALQIDTERGMRILSETLQNLDDDAQEAQLIADLFAVFGMLDLHDFGMSLGALGGHVVWDASFGFAQRPTGYFGLYAPDAPGAGGVPTVLRSGAAGAVSQVFRPARLLQLAKDALTAMGPQAPTTWEEVAADFERETGVRLEQDLVARLGDEMVVLAGAEVMAPLMREEDVPDGMALGMAVRDADGLRDLVRRLITDAGLPLEEEAHAGVPLLRLVIPDGPITIAIGHGYGLLGLGPAGAARVRAALDVLADPARAAAVPAGVAARLELAPEGYDSVAFAHVTPFFAAMIAALEQNDGELPEVPEQALRAARMVVDLLDDHGLDHAVTATTFSGPRGLQRTIW